MFVGEALDTFQLDHQHIFNEKINYIFPDIVAFVAHSKRSLRGSPDAAKSELAKQRALVDLFKEPGAECIRNLKHSAQHFLSKRIGTSAFIGG